MFENWNTARETNPHAQFADNFQTLFVFEMARHGARSHYKKTELPDSYWGPGVKPGYVTSLGRLQHIKKGLDRRREYQDGKGFLSADFNQHEVLSMSTFKQRCAVSGEAFFYGLYPLQNTQFKAETMYQKGLTSFLRGTSYEIILNNMEEEVNKCWAGPVIQVPHHQDIMMHTRNCKTVHDYLNKDQWDKARVEREMKEELGAELVEEYKKKMIEYWKEEPKDIRDYFEMLDARVAELKQAGGTDEMHNMQRQECYILANNFLGDDETPSKVYLYRMIEPITRVLSAKMMQDNNEPLLTEDQKFEKISEDLKKEEAGIFNFPADLKYLIFNLHDTNVSNFLRYLGYWKTHGYKKFVKFGSSVRLELVKRYDSMYCRNPKWDEALKEDPFKYMEQYFIRIVYDDEEIRLPFCESNFCTMEEFINHLTDSLEVDVDIDQYCKMQKGVDPIADKKI